MTNVFQPIINIGTFRLKCHLINRHFYISNTRYLFTIAGNRNLTSASYSRALCEKYRKFPAVKIYKKLSTIPYDSQYIADPENLPEICEEQHDDLFSENNVRNALHIDTNDDVITQLNNSSSVDGVFNILRENRENLSHKHLSHAVLVLWDLKKIYNDNYIENLYGNDMESSPETMLNQYHKQLYTHPDFRILIAQLEKYSESLTVNEATCCLLYLKKLGLAFAEPPMCALLNRCFDKLDDLKLNLIALSRFTAAIGPIDTHIFIGIVHDIFPDIMKFLDAADTPQNFRLITLILQNIHIGITETILDKYKSKLDELIKKQVLTSVHYKMLLKTAHFLNLPHWSRRHSEEIVQICNLIQSEIKNMDVSDVGDLHKIFHTQLQPATILEDLHTRASFLLSEIRHDDRISAYLKIPRLLLCQITASPPEKRLIYERVTSQYITKMFPSTLTTFYRIIRYLKSNEPQLCNKFWEKALEHITANKKHDYILLRYCQKYMYFNTNLNHSYRNLWFEQSMLQSLQEMLDEGYVKIFPKKYARLSSFIIAYGCSTNYINTQELEKILQHLEVISCQLDCLDCLMISKGLQISSILLRRRRTPPKLAYLFLRIDTMLTRRINDFLNNGDLNFSELNALIKTNVNKKSNEDIESMEPLMKMFLKLSDPLNTKVLRDAVYNLSLCRIIVPSFFDEIAAYIATKNEEILGETVQKVLQLYCSLGYRPNNKSFFETAVKVIDRDKRSMTALALLQSCSGLIYFEKLPEHFIRYIFSMEFMERLDAEVATCYSKTIYPARIRKQLMLLNRSVCLELPQYQIPWFQQKYLEEVIVNSTEHTSVFERSVLDCLRDVIPKYGAVAPKIYSPYGIKINFLLHMNESNNAVPVRKDSTPARQIAIILLEQGSFCKLLKEECIQDKTNSTNSFYPVPDGASKLRKRHLEILGYDVIEISSMLWQSMHMSEPYAKVNYLKQVIWGT